VSSARLLSCVQACPSKEELDGMPRQWSAASLPFLDHYPDVVSMVNQVILPDSARLQHIFDQQCRSYTLTKREHVDTVAQFFGVTPTPLPGAASNGTLFCGDFSGTYHSFYTCVPRHGSGAQQMHSAAC